VIGAAHSLAAFAIVVDAKDEKAADIYGNFGFAPFTAQTLYASIRNDGGCFQRTVSIAVAAVDCDENLWIPCDNPNLSSVLPIYAVMLARAPATCGYCTKSLKGNEDDHKAVIALI
jgi:hypothetical protein